jgi:hypothetical protein
VAGSQSITPEGARAQPNCKPFGCPVNKALSVRLPGEGLRAAEDRGFEPRRVVTPNRISSSMPRLPGLSRHDRDCAKSQARLSGKARITLVLTGNAINGLRVRTRNGHARTHSSQPCSSWPSCIFVPSSASCRRTCRAPSPGCPGTSCSDCGRLGWTASSPWPTPPPRPPPCSPSAIASRRAGPWHRDRDRPGPRRVSSRLASSSIQPPSAERTRLRTESARP